MDSHPDQSSSKTFNSNEQENISSNEEGQVSYFIDNYELERWIDEMAKNFELCGNDGIENLHLEPNQYVFRESDQEISLESDNNSISTITNTSLQNTAYHPAPDSGYFPLQQETTRSFGASSYFSGALGNLDNEISYYMSTSTSQPVQEWENRVEFNPAPDYRYFPLQQETPNRVEASAYPTAVSDNEVFNYCTTSISQPVQEWGRNFIEPVIKKLNIHDYMETFTCPSNDESEIRNFNSFNLVPPSLSGDYRTEIHASNPDAFYGNDKGVSDTLQPNEGRILHNTNVPMTMGNEEHRDFWFRHRFEDLQTISNSYKEQQIQILPGVAFQACDAGRIELRNGIEILNSANNTESITGLINERLWSKKDGIFICNICGKGFSNKSYLRIHIRTHTGEKSFMCNECGSSFSKKCHLTSHIWTHKR